MRLPVSLGLTRDGRFMFWAMASWEFGFGLYNLLLTLFIESLGASAFQIGVVVGVQGIVRIAVTLPAGLLAERFPRRSVIVWTTAATVPAAVFCGLARDWWQIIPGMMLMMAGNLGTPAFASYVVDISNPRNRARTFAMIYSVGPSVATIVSPTLGGLIAEHVNTRILFFLAAIAYANSTFLLSRVANRPLAVRPHEEKPSFRDALAIPAVRWLALLKFSVLGTLMIGVVLLPNYLEDHRGLSEAVIGRLGSMQALGSVLLSLLIARIAWISASRGIAVATLATGLLCGVVLASHSLFIIAPAFLLRGGFMVAWGMFASAFGDISPDRLRSRTFAIGDLLGSIGFGLAPFPAGALYSWSPAAPLLFACVVAPALFLAALVVERKFVAPAIRARHNEATVSFSIPGELGLEATA